MASLFILPVSMGLMTLLAVGCVGTKGSQDTANPLSQTCSEGMDCSAPALSYDTARTESLQPHTYQDYQEEAGASSKEKRNGEVTSGITILDAAFTDRIVNRQPESRVTSWRLKDAGARAWLWVKVSCSGPCQRKLASQGRVQLTFHWFKETERGFIKKYSASLPVKAHEWRTWAVKSNLEPGKWKVTILADSGRVCMDGNGKCDFLLDVMP